MRVKTRARKEGRKKKLMRDGLRRDGLRTGRFSLEGAPWRHKTKQNRGGRLKREIYDSPVNPLMRFLKRRSAYWGSF
jgi:hypothetical protein